MNNLAYPKVTRDPDHPDDDPRWWVAWSPTHATRVSGAGLRRLRDAIDRALEAAGREGGAA